MLFVHVLWCAGEAVAFDPSAHIVLYFFSWVAGENLRLLLHNAIGDHIDLK